MAVVENFLFKAYEQTVMDIIGTNSVLGHAFFPLFNY